jgi:isoleucyl-tRNA synthetase
VQQNYKEVDDPAIHVSFPMRSDPSVKFVAWTTTPWTLPSNLALAVNPEFTYVKVKDLKRNEVFIFAECRLKDFFGKEKYEVLEKMKGADLAGIEYVPLFDFFADRAKDGCFRVQTGAFVTDSDGTGIVHCAPGFGEDDYKLCVEKKIISPDSPPVPLDENGIFTKEVPAYEGLYVKAADEVIMKDLKQNGRLVKRGILKHNYPYCWRSDTPLIYKAVSTWFINVSSMRN